jgi:hypothetical protein
MISHCSVCNTLAITLTLLGLLLLSLLLRPTCFDGDTTVNDDIHAVREHE